ncbi:bacillithiol system protein YtxJ [Salinimicrobium sediminis]|uniref:Bacillithiol system protein YtxJ n=1 Tax=Salinimicrobium sediminis TaxID=1343891 RepID=A0A285X5G9_9FLAO|nr:bacillithiol system redox-active protein YtxJ [Salinimicrobium sediminis]MDX1753218.1 bacillithiol system redox-active protein YtxJ [Salinimicrobium sediminis]SOC80565.1 bacillithiol system protein YtxJ [Salinimicrobium sediminis]
MGLFDKVFKSERDIVKKEIEEVPWHALTESKQLEEIEEESEKMPVVVFKHSTRCGISRMVLNNFERSYDLPKDKKVKLYMLDLIANRNISNEVAERFKVRHESPQMIILKDRQVVHHASHQGIDLQDVRTQVK